MISKGDNIKGYIVEDELGSGGFGTVYLVHKKNTQGKKFALKLLKSQFLRERNRREQFINEMITMARLSMHPSIVTIYHTLIYEDQEGEHLGMILEYVQGESLSRFVYHHGKLVAAKAVPLFLQVLDAVQTAHENGIIHRDLKPSNIMVLTGETINYQGYLSTHPVRILDFGLAKITNDGITEETDTMSGISPAYTPPERLIGKRIGPYTDIYAVGVTLYEALAGMPPFQIRSIQDIERVITKEKPSSILTHYEHHPAVLNDVVQKALAKTPEDRYISCAEFGAALAVACPPKSSELPPPPPPPPRWLLALSFLIVLIIGAVAVDKFTPCHIVFFNLKKQLSPVPTGFISIKSNPSEAEVFIDGTRRGETPLELDDISIGNHQLKPRKPPHYKDIQEAISIDPVEKKKLTYTLDESGGNLRILSKPLGAKIFWNGAEYGNTPNTIHNVLKGAYRLILKKENYEDYDETVTLNEMTEKELVVELVKKTGSLEVKTIPSGAELYLDRELIGTTPCNIDIGSPVLHRFEIKKRGYKTYEATISVTDDRTIEKEYILEQDDACADGRLNSAQIRALVTNKKAKGIKLDSRNRDPWEEIQYSDGTAKFTNKDGGESKGHWKVEADQICWCYDKCEDWGCKIIEASDNCSVWYYIDDTKGKYKKTGKVLEFLDI